MYNTWSLTCDLYALAGAAGNAQAAGLDQDARFYGNMARKLNVVGIVVGPMAAILSIIVTWMFIK